MEKTDPNRIRLALPKGRMADAVIKLLGDAGVRVKVGSRGYRPSVSLPNFETKILKPQNIIEMLHMGTRDIGFAGADWVAELGGELVELVDTQLDPVQLVAAAPEALLENGKLPKRSLVIASEYQKLTQRWIDANVPDGKLVRAYGATEVFPPEDADCIVDITQTGSTLRANALQIVDELMQSSTRLYASPKAMQDAGKKTAIEDFALLVRSVLEARARVMVELNVASDKLDAVINVLPSMRQPTVAPLHGEGGYAIKAAVPRAQLPVLIPQLKSCGGTDIVVSNFNQIVA